MKRLLPLALAALVAAPFTPSAEANGLKRLYVLDCGRQLVKDQSRWTPPVIVSQRSYVAVDGSSPLRTE